MNLIANAIKYNAKPTPLVQIGAEPIAEGWEFYVRDDGPGIAPRYHAQIWGLFQTLEPRDNLRSAPGSLHCYATDTSRLDELAPRFLGEPLTGFDLVDL